MDEWLADKKIQHLKDEYEMRIEALEHELKREQTRLDWVFHEDNFMIMFLKDTEDMHMGQVREAIDKEIIKEN